MRILITNDDGITAPGLAALEEIAAALAGPEGEVWVVAPAFEQSGVGHCISYTRPVLVTELGPRRFALEGTPADCVLAAIGEIMPGRPDLVLSGVNRGNNAGENVLYSGTLGGAMEGALQELRAVALSQYLGPATAGLPDPFEAARVHGPGLLRRLLDAGDWHARAGYRMFYNINFPPCPAGAVKGTKVVPQGWRADAFFGTEPARAPSGRRYLWIRGAGQHGAADPDTDVGALLAGHIAVTPLRADLTAHDRLDALAAALATPTAAGPSP